MGKDVVNDDSQVQQTLAHGLAITAIYRLFGIFDEEFYCLLANKLVGNALQSFLGDTFDKSLMDNLIARIPSDVARDELAVHTYGLTSDSVFLGLMLGYLLEALVEKILFELFFMLTKLTAKAIVRVNSWTLLIKSHHTERTTIEQIEATMLIQLFVTATDALLQYYHGNNDAYGHIWATNTVVVLYCRIERFEYLLIDIGGHFSVELIVPSCWVVVEATFTLTQ